MASSNYPTGLDSFPTSHVDGVGEIVRATDINNLADAINKVESELGINPSGSYSTVASAITAAGTVWPISALTIYIDYVNGNDSNTGLSPTLAFKTMQAGYNTLVTRALSLYTPDVNGRLGVGTMILLPGDHNVGNGFIADSRYPVAIEGTLNGDYEPGSHNSASRIYSTSSTATDLVCFGDTTSLTRGNSIRHCGFIVTLATNTSLVTCVNAHQDDYFIAEGNQFSTSDGAGSTDIVAIQQTSIPTGNQDNAWMRIVDNQSKRMTVYKATTGPNFNRGVITGNQCFFDGGTTGNQPGIWLQGDIQGCTVGWNNFDGGQIAIQLESGASDHNWFPNNCGEDGAGGSKTFYNITGSCQFNIFEGGRCTAISGGVNQTGTWITFATNAHQNQVIGRFDYTGFSGLKVRIVDNTTIGNRIDSPYRISSAGSNGFVLGETSAQKLAFYGNAAISRPSGWGAATGTPTRTTFVTSTVTTAQLAEHVKALIDDLTSLGLIGP